jgi:DNA-binding NtrC family response regulator
MRVMDRLGAGGRQGCEFCGMVGRSPAMTKVFEKIKRSAAVDVDVLLIGETGTGKELVARAIHFCSTRCQGRFEAVNCGRLPPEISENELFGHEPGAFTGAQRRSIGFFERANGGTLFLDEIHLLPVVVQGKLLRVLEDREVRRLGGGADILIDIRVIAASSVDLADALSRADFRPELYYRLNSVQIEIPPLRDRREDIPLLAEHFAARCARRTGGEPRTLGAEVVQALAQYCWPGNVRELVNAIEGAFIMGSEDQIRLEDLPGYIRGYNTAAEKAEGYRRQLQQHLSEFGRTYFEHLLQACGGDVSLVARHARVARRTVYRLLKKLEVDPSRYRSAP